MSSKASVATDAAAFGRHLMVICAFQNAQVAAPTRIGTLTATVTKKNLRTHASARMRHILTAKDPPQRAGASARGNVFITVLFDGVLVMESKEPIDWRIEARRAESRVLVIFGALLSFLGIAGAIVILYLFGVFS